MKVNIERLIARQCALDGASRIKEQPSVEMRKGNQHNLEETVMSYSTSSGAGQQRETSGIIAASKVNGTKVYNTAGEALGSIYDVMLDKQSGRVVYAAMSFGGFLGIGEKYHPLPWDQLTYSTVQDGYVVDLDKRILENAPSYGVSDAPDWSSPAYRTGIDEYYHTRH